MNFSHGGKLQFILRKMSFLETLAYECNIYIVTKPMCDITPVGYLCELVVLKYFYK